MSRTTKKINATFWKKASCSVRGEGRKQAPRRAAHFPWRQKGNACAYQVTGVDYGHSSISDLAPTERTATPVLRPATFRVFAFGACSFVAVSFAGGGRLDRAECAPAGT